LADLVRRPHLPIDQFRRTPKELMMRQEMLANLTSDFSD